MKEVYLFTDFIHGTETIYLNREKAYEDALNFSDNFEIEDYEIRNFMNDYKEGCDTISIEDVLCIERKEVIE